MWWFRLYSLQYIVTAVTPNSLFTFLREWFLHAVLGMLASITKTDICRHLNKYIYKLQIYHMPCTPLLFGIKDKLLLSLYFCALVETQYLTLRPKCHKVLVSIRSILLLYSAPWVFKKEQVVILVHIPNAEWKHELLLLRFEIRWPWDPCLHLLPFASSNSNKLEFR